MGVGKVLFVVHKLIYIIHTAKILFRNGWPENLPSCIIHGELAERTGLPFALEPRLWELAGKTK